MVTSATEAETHGVFHNAKLAHIRNLLEGMGHPQPPTVIKTDNSTAVGYAHCTIQQKSQHLGTYNYIGFTAKLIRNIST